MTREEEAIKMLRGMKADNLNLDDLYTRDKYKALVMAIKALKAMNQIYKITDGYAEALYQSETAFDGVASILTEYFEVEE